MGKKHIETETRIIVLIHGAANTTIGITLLLWSNIGAENVLSQYFPVWLWPSMFIAAGVFGFMGTQSVPLARFAFVFAAIVTSVFAAASAWAAVGYGMFGAIPTAVFLTYITILKLAVSRLIHQREDFVRRVVEVTERGKSALDRSNDGTNTCT